MRACICEGVFDESKVVNIRYSPDMSARTGYIKKNYMKNSPMRLRLACFVTLNPHCRYKEVCVCARVCVCVHVCGRERV